MRMTIACSRASSSSAPFPAAASPCFRSQATRSIWRNPPRSTMRLHSSTCSLRPAAVAARSASESRADHANQMTQPLDLPHAAASANMSTHALCNQYKPQRRTSDAYQAVAGATSRVGSADYRDSSPPRTALAEAAIAAQGRGARKKTRRTMMLFPRAALLLLRMRNHGLSPSRIVVAATSDCGVSEGSRIRTANAASNGPTAT